MGTSPRRYLSPLAASQEGAEAAAAAAAAAAAQGSEDAVPPTIFFLRQLIVGVDARIDAAEANLEAVDEVAGVLGIRGYGARRPKGHTAADEL